MNKIRCFNWNWGCKQWPFCFIYIFYFIIRGVQSKFYLPFDCIAIQNNCLYFVKLHLKSLYIIGSKLNINISFRTFDSLNVLVEMNFLITFLLDLDSYSYNYSFINIFFIILIIWYLFLPSVYLFLLFLPVKLFFLSLLIEL